MCEAAGSQVHEMPCFKGDVTTKPEHAQLMGVVINARTAIHKRLILRISNQYDGLSETHNRLVRILKCARDSLGHDLIDNHEKELAECVSLCEKFVREVNSTYPDSDPFVTRKKLMLGKQRFSDFERSVEILFNSIMKEHNIELGEPTVVLDGFYPYGTPDLKQRIADLLDEKHDVSISPRR